MSALLQFQQICLRFEDSREDNDCILLVFSFADLQSACQLLPEPRLLWRAAEWRHVHVVTAVKTYYQGSLLDPVEPFSHGTKLVYA